MNSTKFVITVSKIRFNEFYNSLQRILQNWL